MTKPLPKAKRPGWRWYVAVARLRFARAVDGIPTPNLAGRITSFASALIVAGLSAHMALQDRVPVVAGHPQKAWVQVIWMIVVLIVSALISYALRPKPKVPDAAQYNVPVVEEGKSIVRLYGTCWFDDSMVLAVKQFQPVPIKASGGKKG